MTTINTEADNIFVIPEENIALAEEKIAKLNKTATKLGCTPIVLTILDVEDREFEVNRSNSLDTRTIIRKFYTVEVLGTAPVLSGWSFVAKLDHDYSVPVITSLPDVKVPKIYRNHDASCDHCKSNRARKITYVVQNVETLEYKHVGKSCLKDFLGHVSPTSALRFFEYLASFTDELLGFEEPNTGRVVERYDLKFVLALATKISNAYGYVSAKKARSEYDEHDNPKYTATNSDVSSYLFYPRWKQDFVEDFGDVVEENRTFADEVIEFFKAKSDDSDYIFNLQNLIAEGAIKSKEFPIVVSMVGVYINHLAKEKEAAETKKLNEWFGEAKKRQDAEVKVISIHPFETQYGISYVIKMIDADGRSVVWFASNKTLDEGCSYKVKLTVKNHDKYKGWKQTIVNRVSVVEVLDGES